MAHSAPDDDRQRDRLLRLLSCLSSGLGRPRRHRRAGVIRAASVRSTAGTLVIPAKAGIQSEPRLIPRWIPAFTGTKKEREQPSSQKPDKPRNRSRAWASAT